MNALESAVAGEPPVVVTIPAGFECVEIPELGQYIYVSRAYLNMLKRSGKPLTINVELDPGPSPLPPLTAEQMAVLDYLREHGVTPAEELAHKIGFSTVTIRRWCGKGGPLQLHGVTSTSKGYSLGE